MALFLQVKIKRNHGMSRTIPFVTEESVITIGPKCHVVCLDAETGNLRWVRDLVKEDGAEVPAWYAGQCPLV
jgi:outer membrane protein assembly factor BamB